MSKKEIINKVAMEYKKYGITEEVVQMMYDLAIICSVPSELIYAGMKYIFNYHLGIENSISSNEVAKQFLQYALNDRKKSNPGISDEVLNASIIEEILSDEANDAIKSIGEVLPSNIQHNLEKEMCRFVKDNS